MAEQTLLEMTQNILSALDSDEVNSISDTVESMQVAKIIQNKYYDILARGELPEQNILLQLTPSNDTTKPTLMYLPSGVSKIEWIKYYDSNPNNSPGVSQFGSYAHDLNLDLEDPEAEPTTVPPGYKYVNILPTQDFIDLVNNYSPIDSNTISYTFTEGDNSFIFHYKNNIQPSYCAIIENTYILFDSYDSAYDDTLQASKTLVYGQYIPTFQLTDSFIPDIDDNQFPLLLNEAKSLAFFELKQTAHSKADLEIKRQWSTVQKNKSVADRPSYFDQLPGFGRMPRTGGIGRVYGVNRWMRQTNP